MVTELWLVPKGSNPPQHRAANLQLNVAIQFDALTLVNQYGVAAQRIVTNLGTSRRCRKIDLWLAPSGLRVPKDSNIELLSQSQLIAEAEKNRYTIRRLEFIGNEHIRDQVVRRRLWALQEGEIFTKKALTKGLLSLNRPADIHPVRLDDVDVRLDRREKTVDLRIVITERRRQL